MDKTRISAITDEIGKSADEAVDFAQDNGLVAVELRNQPGSKREYALGREADIEAAAAHLANQKIKVSLLHTSLLQFTWPGTPGPGAPDQARWDRRLDDLRKALRCAQIAGCDKIGIFAGARATDPPQMFERIAGTLSEMAAEAEKQKVSLLLENHPATNVATCAELAAVMKLAPSKWLGIDWTPAPDSYAVLPKKRILNVRAPAASLTPGKPESADWKAILLALDKDGYGGRIAVSGASVALVRDSLDEIKHIIREVA